MALQKAYDDQFGNSNPKAYFRVVQILFNDMTNVQFVVHAFKDEIARRASKQPIGQFNYVVIDQPPSTNFTDYFAPAKQDQLGVNPWKSSYDYLKKLPEFQGAIDV